MPQTEPYEQYYFDSSGGKRSATDLVLYDTEGIVEWYVYSIKLDWVCQDIKALRLTKSATFEYVENELIEKAKYLDGHDFDKEDYRPPMENM